MHSAASRPRVIVIFGQAERANRLPVLPGDKALGSPVFEKLAAFRVDTFLALREQRRDPERISLVDAPGEGQEEAFFMGSGDGAEFDHDKRDKRAENREQVLSD
jgi:hypothetical protein